jgi:xanthosine utilization system XapX-like protein
MNELLIVFAAGALVAAVIAFALSSVRPTAVPALARSRSQGLRETRRG